MQFMTDLEVAHLMLEVSERNERISRSIETARRLILVLLAAAFGAGYMVASIVGYIRHS